MQADWFEGLAGLRQLGEDWAALHGACDLYARHEWHLAVAGHLQGEALACAYCRLRDGQGRVQAIVPAIDGRVHLPLLGRQRATTLGLHSHLALFDFPLAPDADPAAVGAALLRALRARPGSWTVLSWPRLMATSHAARVARALRAPAACIWAGHPCNTFDTARPFASLQEGLSKKFRSNLRWCRRRLADEAPLRVCHAREEGRLGPAFEEFLRIEASGWKGRAGAGSAVALAPGARGFYEALLAQHGPGFESDIALLSCGEQVVAAEFLLRAARWQHVYKIGYAESQARYSPGHLLFESVLERACADPGTDRVSLVTDEAWQSVWQPIAEPTVHVVALRPAWREAVFSAYLLARRAVHARRARAATAAAPPLPQE
jgi:hypothetical protein